MISRQNLASSYIFQPPSSDNEKKELSNLVDNLSGVGKIALVVNGQEIEVPSIIYVALTEVVKTLNNGDSVTLIPMDKELTTQQAADILNVSRPYFIKLLENGTIKFRKTGTHRKVLMQDLIEYRDKRAENRRANIEEMSKLSQELGLYD
ncbi:MAG: helix-turn-helix domain-containing protein [bacterium]|nr:helix-turn-helix domain-containing protein [bacterium]